MSESLACRSPSACASCAHSLASGACGLEEALDVALGLAQRSAFHPSRKRWSAVRFPATAKYASISVTGVIAQGHA